MKPPFRERAFLTPLFFSWTGLLLVVLSLSFYFQGFLLVYAIGLGVLIAVAWRDFLPRGRPAAIAYRASLNSALDEEMNFDWELRAVGAPRGAKVTVYTPPTRHFEFSQPRFDFEPSQLSRGPLKVSVKALPKKLGRERLPPVRVESRSRLGLWARQSFVELEGDELSVSPMRRAVSPERFQQIIGEQNFFRVSQRTQMRRQDLDELHTIRDYAFPDPLRFVDARKSARYQKPMTRVFESSYNQQLIIVLDCGRTLAGRLGRSMKLDFYLSVVIALAEEAFARGDQVSFFAVSDRMHYQIVDSRDLRDFRSVREALSSFQARDVETDYQRLVEIYNRVGRQRGIFVALSDFFRPSVQTRFLETLPQINRRHLVLLASLLEEDYLLETQLARLTPDRLRTLDPREYARLLVGYNLAAEARQFKARLNAQKAGWVAASEKEWMSVVPKAYALLRQSLRT